MRRMERRISLADLGTRLISDPLVLSARVARHEHPTRGSCGYFEPTSALSAISPRSPPTSLGAARRGNPCSPQYRQPPGRHPGYIASYFVIRSNSSIFPRRSLAELRLHDHRYHSFLSWTSYLRVNFERALVLLPTTKPSVLLLRASTFTAGGDPKRPLYPFAGKEGQRERSLRVGGDWKRP
jgi:hypothetical protein